jgi:enoyl-CoA hydratase/carnithine racemase
LVGQKNAADLILTGRSITGKEAAGIGLANRADAEVEPVLQETLQQLSKLSAAALSIAKKANYAWDSMHFDKGLARAEKIYLEELMKTADVHEGISAFMEKRLPVWKGR